MRHSRTNIVPCVPKGYSLAEMVVVILILGILSAIVVPQFTNASDGDRQSALHEQMRTVRAAIEFYKAQHHDALPDLGNSWKPLLIQTDIDGGTSGKPLFGPYLLREPINPITGGGKISASPGVGTDWNWDSYAGTVSAFDRSGNTFDEAQ